MANVSNAKGFVQVDPLQVPSLYPIDAHAALIFIGDAVSSVADEGVVAAAAGAAIKGAVASIFDENGQPSKNYPGGSATGYTCTVYDDPDMKFMIQCNTALTAEDIGEYADLVADLDGNPTGLSGQYLGAFSATAATFKLSGIDARTDNEWGAFQNVIVTANEHEDKDVVA